MIEQLHPTGELFARTSREPSPPRSSRQSSAGVQDPFHSRASKHRHSTEARGPLPLLSAHADRRPEVDARDSTLRDGQWTEHSAAKGKRTPTLCWAGSQLKSIVCPKCRRRLFARMAAAYLCRLPNASDKRGRHRLTKKRRRRKSGCLIFFTPPSRSSRRSIRQLTECEADKEGQDLGGRSSERTGDNMASTSSRAASYFESNFQSARDKLLSKVARANDTEFRLLLGRRLNSGAGGESN